MDKKKVTDLDAKRLWIRASLSLLLLGVFCILLLLIFFVELPKSMETLSSVLLGALVGNLTSTLSYWFDSTEHAGVVQNGNGT